MKGPTVARGRNARFAVTLRRLGAGLAIAALAAASSVLLACEAEANAKQLQLAHVPRAWFDTIVVAGALSVADFSGSGERLLLLDRRALRVIDVRRESRGEWRVERSFGRAGDGPGEFSVPRSIALRGTHIIVTDRSRLHVFDTAGNFIRTQRPRLPCPATRMYLADSDKHWLAAAECIANDTVFAALLSSADGETYNMLARDSRFTTTGDWGSHFFALRALSDVPGGVLFGVGRTSCVLKVVDAEGADVAQVCGRLTRFMSSAPERFRSAGPRAQRWPKHLPYFVDRTRIGDSIAVWRPFSADSMVLQLLGSGRSVLVAGLSDFVACRRAGCLWTIDDAQSTRLLFLPLSRMR
jgi:hypothetical protein